MRRRYHGENLVAGRYDVVAQTALIRAKLERSRASR